MSVDVGTARMNADLYVGGAGTEGRAGTLDNVDPGNGQVVGAVSLATAEQVDDAVTAAVEAFPSWSSLAGSARGDVLRRAAALLVDRTEEAVATILLETGK